ncbi:TPA: lecithin retinol acyltransferase family protein [Burkholderia stabilis]|nr:lecithin retinol acyltransferase family protein [Burkholderia stabilis]HDR9524331.1 lecithin retinol acyltransferase family protein [Burkholderia stabilis]HDR9541488.1 lecithin retinol acyltransferase family protein [Burkholderia stabilis]HDR9571304.1 lecithin retinol acyltransferase family protein [Burkholderia stabilis]HDR9579566.1 lecithin retinol acyltransferase family protein [Burkholderia stabilis]
MNHPTSAQSGITEPGSEWPVGAHLVTRRRGYVHHGIYIGEGQVIHYAGLSRRLSGGPVEIISIDHFAAGFELAIIRHAAARYSGSEVARRAASRLGERHYRLLTNNCEHFCRWCLFGASRSEQVEACLRNPVHGIAVVTMLAVCVIAGRLHDASHPAAPANRSTSRQCAPWPELQPFRDTTVIDTGDARRGMWAVSCLTIASDVD